MKSTLALLSLLAFFSPGVRPNFTSYNANGTTAPTQTPPFSSSPSLSTLPPFRHENVQQADGYCWSRGACRLPLKFAPSDPRTVVSWSRFVPWAETEKQQWLPLGNSSAGCDPHYRIGLKRCTVNMLHFLNPPYGDADGVYRATWTEKRTHWTVKVQVSVHRPEAVIVPRSVTTPTMHDPRVYTTMTAHLYCAPLYDRDVWMYMQFNSSFRHGHYQKTHYGRLRADTGIWHHLPKLGLVSTFQVRCCANGMRWGLGLRCTNWTTLYLSVGQSEHFTDSTWCRPPSKGFRAALAQERTDLEERFTSSCFRRGHLRPLTSRPRVCEGQKVDLVKKSRGLLAMWYHQPVPRNDSQDFNYRFNATQYLRATSTGLNITHALPEQHGLYNYAVFNSAMFRRSVHLTVEPRARVFLHLVHWHSDYFILQCRHNLPSATPGLQIMWQVEGNLRSYYTYGPRRSLLHARFDCWNSWIDYHSLFHIRCVVVSDLQIAHSDYFGGDFWKAYDLPPSNKRRGFF